VIPYIPPEYTTLLKLGPLEIHLFGVLVATGILLGANRTRYRGRQLGLSDEQSSSLATWVVVCGFVVAHVFDVIAYTPEQLASRSPLQTLLLLINIPAGISSFGGFLGALLGLLYWVRRERVPILVCADSLLYGLAFGWFFGRLGCFTAHDHPGALTSFFLAVNYPEGPRHDLGFDEALFAGALALAFAILGRRPHRVGFYAAIACLAYGPVRFGLDFLRVQGVANADPRYFGLTPAQYGSVLVFAVGVAIAARILVRGPDAASEGRPVIAPPPGQPAAKA
jgi:phosphatidylglycerol:prolipoprotein diacylglycerol transferase